MSNYSLRVFALSAMAGVAGSVVLTGCGVTSFTAAFLPPETRLAQSETSLQSAIAALERGDTNAAHALLDDAVTLRGGDVQAQAEIAQRLIQQGRAEEAATRLQAVVDDKSQDWNPLSWGILAQAAEKKRDATRARQARTEARRRAEAVLQRASGLDNKANDNVKSEASRQLLDTGAYFLLAGVEDAPKAIEALRAAQRLAPNEPETLNALGYTLAEYGKSPAEQNEAVDLTLKAVRLAPTNGAMLDSYGWALFKRGDKERHDFDGARRVLREATDLSPSYPEIHFHLGMVYAHMYFDKVALADLEFRRAQMLRPDYPEAKAAQKALEPRVKAASPSPSPGASPTPAPLASPSPSPSPPGSPSPQGSPNPAVSPAAPTPSAPTPTPFSAHPTLPTPKATGRPSPGASPTTNRAPSPGARPR